MDVGRIAPAVALTSRHPVRGLGREVVETPPSFATGANAIPLRTRRRRQRSRSDSDLSRSSATPENRRSSHDHPKQRRSSERKFRSSGSRRSRSISSEDTSEEEEEVDLCQVGDPLHPDGETLAPGQLHPKLLVKGTVLKAFTTPPPSKAEIAAFQKQVTRGKIRKINQDLSKRVNNRTIPVFVANGEPKNFREWEASVQTFFAQERVTNSATQAHLAERTFSGPAAVWMAEHRKMRPRLLLSWSQLKELVKMEQLPDIDAGASFRKWNALTYDGDIEAYLKKVAELRLSHPLSPRDSYICGAQPLSASLAAKIQSLTRRMDMTPPEWEEMLRVFVLRQEEDGRPVVAKKHPKVRLAQVDEEEEVTSGTPAASDVPPGWEDEEWMAALYAITATTPRGYASRKIGKGPRPCYICGADGHSWVNCAKKKAGRCGTCASQQHDTRNCWESYRPDPNSRPPSPRRFEE